METPTVSLRPTNILLGVLVAINAASCYGVERSASRLYSLENPTWKYAVVSIPDRDLELNLTRLGAEGWEIVSARRATDGLIARYELICKHRTDLYDATVTKVTGKPPS